jgi:hypothetical protein
MGHELAAKTDQIVSAMKRAEAAYRTARAEFARLELNDKNDDIDCAVHEFMMRAYELESFLRGFAKRIEKGELLEPDWNAEFGGFWRFHKAENFSHVLQRASSAWPFCGEYLVAVVMFDITMREFL